MKKYAFILILLTALFSAPAAGADSLDTLWHNFVNPPDSSRTKVWWFHGEIETTKEGIDADLASFKEMGIGGVVFYNQVHGKCEGALPSMSPQWWEMLKYAATAAKRLSLSFEVAAGNGYVTGGPWITPELAMKKTDYVERLVYAPSDTAMQINLKHRSDMFRDVALIMFEDNPLFSPLPLPDKQIVINTPDTIIPFPSEKRLTIRGISYDITPRGKGSTASMNIPGDPADRYFGAKYMAYPPIGQLECSDDNMTWRAVTDLLPVENTIGHKSSRRTISFPAVDARFFRLNLHHWNGNDSTYRSFRLSDIVLHTRDIVDNIQVRSGLRTEITYPHPTGADTGAIDPGAIKILDCTIDSAGYAKINIPRGHWRIIRFGYLPTGMRSKHGLPNQLGLEADVMSAEAAATHYHNYFRQILDTLSKAGARPTGMCMDSHEAGIQNWTKGFEKTFSSRNGYDLIPWLPALAGYIVESRETTDRVLADFRKTVTATISSQYYATLARLCKEDSVDFTSQAMLNILTDNIEFRGHASKPQGEFWAYQKNGNYDCLDAASAAHLFGKNIASGEAFTDTPYDTSWHELIRIANIAYCRGINEFAVCASSYQPWPDRKYDDSMSLHPYVFHRFHPRWNSSRPFWDYQARCADLLRKGKPVVDLLVYVGEEAPLKTFTYRLPAIPEGYNFDVCSLPILSDRISANPDGTIFAKGGMTYKAIIIPEKTYISPAAERILERIASQGATIIRCDKGESTAEALNRARIAPDIAFKSPARPDNKLMFFHRALPDADIYFIYNHSPQPFNQQITLRTSHPAATIWDPLTCTRQTPQPTPSLPTPDTPSLSLPLSLQPYQSCFLITRED